LQYRCRACCNAAEKERRRTHGDAIRAAGKRNRERGRERIKAQKAASYLRTRDRVLAKCAERYRKNPDRMKRRVAAWQKANPERTRASKRKWAKNNPDACKRLGMRRRARIAKAFVEDVSHAALAKRDGRRCKWCGRSDLPLAVDHVTPIARGGKHAMWNCVLACKPCNSRKGSKLPLVFLMERA